ncbi:hypothetical protein [Rhizobium leguminosarum]|uniref:hypothetical protein n=1 Tax=Rhizobium leguminosarum TaxID=384 RepID=UPI001FD9BD2C|nr:hypothetical protein [Rhizobium leguminosarum]
MKGRAHEKPSAQLSRRGLLHIATLPYLAWHGASNRLGLRGYPMPFQPRWPTQFAECRPPIQKLWRELSEGHSFPTCSGVGFRSSRPGYEPHYCETGYRLESDYGPRGREATCVSTALQPVSNAFCPSVGDGYNFNKGLVLSPRWQREDGRRQCMGYSTARPNVPQLDEAASWDVFNARRQTQVLVFQNERSEQSQ